ncbi:hypothetical protein JHK85_026512 [Glycine max]|nr:hypothetical protein JHK85_026512 [Glycine max]
MVPHKQNGTEFFLGKKIFREIRERYIRIILLTSNNNLQQGEEKREMGEYSCALCKKRAMMLCDSDQAKLCWECDEKVHSANFLVAKHSRVLLCRLCHSPTPWKASGTKLMLTVSFCQRCVAHRHVSLTVHPYPSYGYQSSNNNDDVDLDVDDGIDDSDERESHQVMSSSATSPFKRLRNNSFSVDSNDETVSSSSEMFSATWPDDDESTTSLSVLKRHRDDQPNY